MKQIQITKYLNQFNDNMELGLKLLEQINYFSHPVTTTMVRHLVADLNHEITLTNNDVFFCSVSMSQGKSSDVIMGKVKDELHMSAKKYDDKFLSLRDLLRLNGDNSHKKIIFLDDFIGSGGTMMDLWGILSSLGNENYEYYVGALLGYDTAISNIELYTTLQVICTKKLGENDRIFNAYNSVFTPDEKSILKEYCEKVDPREDYRYGYKNSQSLVIFYHNAPNNTIPILHHKTDFWKPLFLRSE